jgi:hypothetical protein
VKFEFAEKPENLKNDILKFLTPTRSVAPELKPPITEHYAQSFSAVDRFGQYLGYMKYPYRIHNLKFLWFVSVLRNSVLNAFSLFCETKKIKETDNDHEDLILFIKSISVGLKQRYRQ